MSSQNTSHSYIPIQSSTPTQTPQSTPISTPTKAKILRSNFLTRGSPIKFNMSTPEKAKLRDVEFDFEDEKMEKTKGLDIRKVVFQAALGFSWAVLASVAIYLSIQYITTAALGVTRWMKALKTVYSVAMAFSTVGVGFSLGYILVKSLGFSLTPWHGSLDHPRPFLANWLLFLIFLIGLPVGCTLVPFILGKSGEFNPAHHAWNSACMDPKYTTMLHIKYLATIGNPFSMTMYARLEPGHYYFLGLLPTTPPNNANVILSTPNFILNPTTDPIVPSMVAGQEMFSLTNTSVKTLIATIELSTGQNGSHSILGKCIPSGSHTNNFTTCANGFLSSGPGESNDSVVANPFLRSIGKRIKTLEVMYDTVVEGSNGTFLRGYLDSWPGDLNWFMSGDVASLTAPNARLEESNADGTVLNTDGVQIVSAPWPGCEGIKVCATNGLSGLIVSGWIWENLERWTWYSKEDCMA